MTNKDITKQVLLFGVLIDVVFRPAKNQFFANLLLSAFEKTLQPYIVKNKKQSIRRIVIRESPENNFLLRNDRIFTEIGVRQSKEVVIYYSTSMRQLSDALMQVVLEEITKRQGLMFHASCSLSPQGALVFIGQSGAGKSTITRLLEPLFPILADDQILLDKNNDQYLVSQLFVPEANSEIGLNKKSYPFRSVFFLKQSGGNKLNKVLDKSLVLCKLAKAFFNTKDLLDKNWENLALFVKRNDSFFELEFTNKPNLISFFSQPKLLTESDK